MEVMGAMSTTVSETRFRILARSAGDRRQFLGEGGDGAYYLLNIDRTGVHARALDGRAAQTLQFSPAWHPVHDRTRHSVMELRLEAARM